MAVVDTLAAPAPLRFCTRAWFRMNIESTKIEVCDFENNKNKRNP